LVKSAPFRVTLVPRTPLAGVKLVMIGASPVTMKLLLVVSLPKLETTSMS
jgi:hypothetical protein